MSLALGTQHIRDRSPQPLALETPLDLKELPTPALVLNKPLLEKNIAQMASYLSAKGKGFRPHAKTHKCPLIARLQLEAGAVGICVAKVSEAIAMVSGGIQQILITSPITTPGKAQVVAELCGQARDLNIVVDSQTSLNVLTEALAQTEPPGALGVLIDLDVGLGRTGTRDDGLVRDLVLQISGHDRLGFRGFQHYAGHVMHIEGYAARRDVSLDMWRQVMERLDGLAIDYEILTGGGTGTYNIDVDVQPITDLQVGSYVFMDEEYRRIGSPAGERFDDFDVSLTMACTTISSVTGRTTTVDGGYKAFASDTVAPVCDELPGVTFRFAGDEHGVLIKPPGEQSLRLGEVIQMVTPHCDPTVNLHDYYWVQEADELVHSVWPITARGCTW